MNFDWTINVGHIITGGGLIIGAVGIIWALRSDVKVLATRIGSIEMQILKVADVLVHIGRQDERLKSHERRLDKLEERDG